MYYNESNNYCTCAGTVFYKVNDGEGYAYRRPFSFPKRNHNGLSDNWKLLEHSTTDIRTFPSVKFDFVTTYENGSQLIQPCFFRVSNLPAHEGLWVIAEAFLDFGNIFDKISFYPKDFHEEYSRNYITAAGLYHEVWTSIRNTRQREPDNDKFALPEVIDNSFKY